MIGEGPSIDLLADEFSGLGTAQVLRLMYDTLDENLYNRAERYLIEAHALDVDDIERELNLLVERERISCLMGAAELGGPGGRQAARELGYRG